MFVVWNRGQHLKKGQSVCVLECVECISFLKHLILEIFGIVHISVGILLTHIQRYKEYGRPLLKTFLSSTKSGQKNLQSTNRKQTGCIMGIVGAKEYNTRDSPTASVTGGVITVHPVRNPNVWTQFVQSLTRYFTLVYRAVLLAQKKTCLLLLRWRCEVNSSALHVTVQRKRKT